MPDEGEIEKTLKAYAQKRREQAGEPLELHPATRRMLQAEAARQAPRAPARPDFWPAVWLAFRRRLAVVGIFAVLAAASAWLYWPGPGRGQRQARGTSQALAKNETKQFIPSAPPVREEVAAPTAAPAPAPVA